MKLWWFKLRVSIIGWKYHRCWVWGTIDNDEWQETYECHDGHAMDAYAEGWCRE